MVRMASLPLPGNLTLDHHHHHHSNNNATMSDSGPISGPIAAPKLANTTAPTPSAPQKALRYRGACVEDLQLPPAVCVGLATSIDAALRLAHDHDYSQLPVMAQRSLRGYLDVKATKERLETGEVRPGEPVSKVMMRFRSSKTAATAQGGKDGAAFTVIVPDTGLAELEDFLETHPFAFVTDASSSFVLAVATRDDLSRYIQRRGLGSSVGAEGSAAGAEGATTPTRTLPTATQPLSRREEEERRKDRTLGEFLGMLDGDDPLIPDEVTDYYLSKVGFECDDQRLKRLLSLAAEKFVSDIATDAFQYARIRTNAGPGRTRTAAGASRDRARTVLTYDDLSAALGEYGINSRKPEFYK